MEASVEQRRQYARKLREIRDLRGLTLRELARRVNDHLGSASVTHQTISNWERETHAPETREIVVAVEQVLDAEGELLPLLGQPAAGNLLEDRIARVEAQLAEVRELQAQVSRQEDVLGRLVRRLEDPPDQGAS